MGQTGIVSVFVSVDGGFAYPIACPYCVVALCR